jgi:autophagy-related protein 33
MEASYEVLGSGSDAHSEGTGSASGEDLEAEDEQVNGEEVRTEVENFLKKQMIQTAVSGLSFLLAIVGIWGDGVTQVFQSDVFVVEV